MSRVRLSGILLFLFIPAVLALFLRLPLGLGPSIVTGVAIMLAHPFAARPFMRRHLGRRCFWCGRDLRDGGRDAAFLVRGEVLAARACRPEHASDLAAFARAVSAGKVALAAAIGLPVAVYLANAFATMAGAGVLPLDVARLVFMVPIAAAVVSLSFAWPLARSSSRAPAIDLPAHNLSLLGVWWTLWVFRVVGLFWLGEAAWGWLAAR